MYSRIGHAQLRCSDRSVRDQKLNRQKRRLNFWLERTEYGHTLLVGMNWFQTYPILRENKHFLYCFHPNLTGFYQKCLTLAQHFYKITRFKSNVNDFLPSNTICESECSCFTHYFNNFVPDKSKNKYRYVYSLYNVVGIFS